MGVQSVLRLIFFFFFFSSRRRHTRCLSDWSSDVCSSDLMHTDQWRYERDYADYHTMPKNPLIRDITGTHTADVNVQAVRNGWLPFYPQFDRSPLQVVRDAQTAD